MKFPQRRPAVFINYAAFAMRIVLFLAIILLCAKGLTAQKPAALKSSGETAFADQRWEEAYQNLIQYQQLKPGDPGVLSKIGQSAYFLHYPDQARQYLEYITAQRNSNDPMDWYYMARTWHGLMEWEKAIEAYKQFLRKAGDSHPLRDNARDNILRCVSGMSTLPDDNVALVENFGPTINSSGDEFAPLRSVNHRDRIYFAASKKGATGGIRNDDGLEDEQRGHWCSDMYVARLTAGGWEAARPFSGLQNTARFELPLAFTDHGQVLHFFRGFTLYGGQIFTDTASLNDEYRATAIPFTGPVNPETGDEALYYVNDSTMLFASRREGGLGGLDLWASRRINGQWEPATHLGPEINSPYDETTPFVSNDGKTLWFSSNRTSSMGGHDVWRSTFDARQHAWSKAQPLGAGINSPGDDLWFQPAPDGSSAWVVSNRLTDNLGQRDLYTVYYKEPLAEQQSAGNFAFFQQSVSVANTGLTTPTVALSPVFYANDRDINSPAQKSTYQTAAAVLKQFGSIKLLVTTHTNETGPLKFDLYNGIKRAEIAAKSLVQAGAPDADVLLRSVGPGFPMAKNVINGKESPESMAFNQRIDISPVSLNDPLPFQFRLDRPFLGEESAAAGTARLDALNKGLLFRVELAETRQVLTSDALGLFNDLLIESVAGSGTYHYLCGSERTFNGAAQLKKEAVNAGFSGAKIAAYLNGVPLTKPEAIAWIKKYPELASYIKS